MFCVLLISIILLNAGGESSIQKVQIQKACIVYKMLGGRAPGIYPKHSGVSMSKCIELCMGDDQCNYINYAADVCELIADTSAFYPASGSQAYECQAADIESSFIHAQIGACSLDSKPVSVILSQPDGIKGDEKWAWIRSDDVPYG